MGMFGFARGRRGASEAGHHSTMKDGELRLSRVVGVGVIGLLCAVAAALVLHFCEQWLHGSKLLRPSELGEIGTFLSYAVGIAITMAGIAITVNISWAANRISRRLGDSDILNFVDTRLASVMKAVRNLAQSIDRTHDAPVVLFKLVNEIFTKANEHVAKNEISLPDAYDAQLDVAAKVLVDAAPQELMRYRELLRQMYADLSQSLLDMLENPLTLALLHVSLGCGSEREDGAICKRYSQKIVDILRTRGGEKAVERVPELESVPDILSALRERLAEQQVFTDLPDSADDLLPLARKFLEATFAISSVMEVGDAPPLVIFGALISLEVTKTREEGSNAPYGVACNHGLVLLATILESLPSRQEFETLFRQIYNDVYSERLAIQYIETCGIDREMYWSTDHKRRWAEVQSHPEWAVYDVKYTLEEYLQRGSREEEPATAQRHASRPQAWWRRDRRPPAAAPVRPKLIDAMRIAARVRTGDTLVQACEAVGACPDHFAAQPFPAWYAALGEFAADRAWFDKLAAAAIASRMARR